MKRQRHVVWFVFCLFLLSGGCSTAVLVGTGAGAGVGTYSYVKGEMRMDYPYPYDQTWDASLTALRRLDIEVTSRERDAMGGKINGKTADGAIVAVKLKDKGLGVTQVGVRVGTFGDRESSRKVHETIVKAFEG